MYPIRLLNYPRNRPYNLQENSQLRVALIDEFRTPSFILYIHRLKYSR